MRAKHKSWLLFATVQTIGAAFVIVGSGINAPMQIGGFALLLPGSVIAAALPLSTLWHPLLWQFLRTDAAGLSNAIYLPVTILLNMLICWAVLNLRSRRHQN